MSNEQSAQMAESLLNAFLQQVPARREPPPTFMQITGYPHYEDVCSNILGFFLDPKEPHELGTLFLDAIACIGEIEDQQGMWDNVKVTREEYTEAGKRIDILIQSDSHAVLIENKIFAGPDNPFADYAKHLCSLRKTQKHKFLLTLNDEEATARKWGFQNITHQELVERVRKLLGAYIAGADTRYLTFMLDFLSTLENLKEDVVVNEKFTDFLKNQRPGEIERFLRHIHGFKNELRKKVDELRKGCPVESYHNVRATPYHGDEPKVDLFGVLAHDIELQSFNNNVVVETGISSEGWKILIWLRNVERGGPPNRGPVDGGQEELKGFLVEQSIPLADDKGEGYGEGTRFLFQRFDYNADLDEVARAVRDVVHKLATSERPAT